MYRRILVPTDGSPIAEAAAGPAIELARASGGEILTLCVAIPEPVLQSMEGAMTYDPGLRIEELLEHAHGYTGVVEALARQAGVPCTPLVCTALDPADAIVDAARKHACDLIVIGSHGRRGLSRLLAGSVTQGVLAYAPVPVMVLRPSPAEAGTPAAARTWSSATQG